MVEHTESKVQQGERYVVIGREPFARIDRVRRVVENKKGCFWCGQKRKGDKLFAYGVWRDGVSILKIGWLRGEFCSISCMRAYHQGQEW